MAVWFVPAVKAILPYVSAIVTATIPVFKETAGPAPGGHCGNAR